MIHWKQINHRKYPRLLQCLTAPILIIEKMCLQDLWVREFDWDDPIEDQTVRHVWHDLLMDLQDVSWYKVQRYIGTEKKDGKVYNSVCFCDASKKAYATIVYLHQESYSDSEASLVFLKTRLAPVKEIMIRRLELMAILIGVRCIQYVKEQLKLDITNTYLWSDLQVALSCINSDQKSK